MTRIIGGSAGGRRLSAPSGDRTRPTSDRVREALFSAIESALGSLSGLRFLDMYAGSGAVGLGEESEVGNAADENPVTAEKAVTGLVGGDVPRHFLSAARRDASHFSTPRFFHKCTSVSFLRMIAYCWSSERTLFHAQ